MFKLLKGGYCYAPESLGVKDVLVGCGKILKVEENISQESLWDLKVVDCKGKLLCPGFIDQHVHILGGGGEEGPVSRIPEVYLSDLTTAGVSTLVGVLGVDSITRSIGELLAKARALETEGINTFIYTGSYSIPTATLTGSVMKDIAFMDKALGVGEIAISDYRSSYPTTQMLKSIASEAKIGGLIGGKAGIVHIHVGDGKEGLMPLLKLIEESDFPVEMFVPTHINRNKTLFEQGMEYVKRGGFIDLTAGEKTGKGYSVPDALGILIANGIEIEKVTVSSDGNGSIPSEENGNTGVGKVLQLFEDIRNCCLNKSIDFGKAVKTVTSNVAKVLKIFPRKGTLLNGSDADILVLNDGDLSINKLLINGEFFIDNGNIIRKGRYEK